jgi:hypothetical protein
VADALSRVAKAKIPNESTDKIVNTVKGLVEYFNKTYEFYGRRLRQPGPTVRHVLACARRIAECALERDNAVIPAPSLAPHRDHAGRFARERADPHR